MENNYGIPIFHRAVHFYLHNPSGSRDYLFCSRCPESIGLVWRFLAKKNGGGFLFDGDGPAFYLPFFLFLTPERYRALCLLPCSPLRPGGCWTHGGGGGRG